MDKKLKNLYIRVIREERNTNKKPMLTHLCSVNSNIYSMFLIVCNTSIDDLPDYLSKWTENDFNVVLDFTMNNHIRILRELVIDKYSRLYPHMYYNLVTLNDQLWTRVWVSEQMGKEIRRNDRIKYKELFGSA